MISRPSPICPPSISPPDSAVELSIARVVAVSRPVWLLDEPTSALDAPSQARLSEIMRNHLAGGGIIIAAAHGAIGLERARELTLGAA